MTNKKTHCGPCLGEERGTGRTRRMVEGLTDKIRFVVAHNSQSGWYIERMIRNLRPDLYRNKPGPRVIVIQSLHDIDRLRGCMFEADHAVWDLGELNDAARDALEILYRIQRR